MLYWDPSYSQGPDPGRDPWRLAESEAAAAATASTSGRSSAATPAAAAGKKKKKKKNKGGTKGATGDEGRQEEPKADRSGGASSAEEDEGGDGNTECREAAGDGSPPSLFPELELQVRNRCGKKWMSSGRRVSLSKSVPAQPSGDAYLSTHALLAPIYTLPP